MKSPKYRSLGRESFRKMLFWGYNYSCVLCFCPSVTTHEDCKFHVLVIFDLMVLCTNWYVVHPCMFLRCVLLHAVNKYIFLIRLKTSFFPVNIDWCSSHIPLVKIVMKSRKIQFVSGEKEFLDDTILGISLLILSQYHNPRGLSSFTSW